MQTSANSQRTQPVRAAVRFPLHLDIVVTTESGDFNAVTQDVSAKGVLFAAAEVPAVGTPVSFKLTMPSTIMGGNEDVVLHCVGHIVRHERTAGKNMAAAVIEKYSLKGLSENEN